MNGAEISVWPDAPALGTDDVQGEEHIQHKTSTPLSVGFGVRPGFEPQLWDFFTSTLDKLLNISEP